jgi:hypothetical protein
MRLQAEPLSNSKIPRDQRYMIQVDCCPSFCLVMEFTEIHHDFATSASSSLCIFVCDPTNQVQPNESLRHCLQMPSNMNPSTSNVGVNVHDHQSFDAESHWNQSSAAKRGSDRYEPKQHINQFGCALFIRWTIGSRQQLTALFTCNSHTPSSKLKTPAQGYPSSTESR